MKVILTQDVKAQGKKGDVIDVSDGYARNYLIKNGFAKEATSVNLNSLKISNEAETVGSHTVIIKPYAEVQATLKVVVVGE